MNTVERIKSICKERKIPVSRLEKDLNFGNAYIAGLKKGTVPDDRLGLISKYLNVSVEYLMTGEETEKEGVETYYLNDETAEIAQEIFENKELRLLFDAAKDAQPEDLQTVHQMLLALKRKERGDID